jgi:hypothetical protein
VFLRILWFRFRLHTAKVTVTPVPVPAPQHCLIVHNEVRLTALFANMYDTATSVADQHNFDADSDPACHLDADPVPAYHFNADTDPEAETTFQFAAGPCGSGSTTLKDNRASPATLLASEAKVFRRIVTGLHIFSRLFIQNVG